MKKRTSKKFKIFFSVYATIMFFFTFISNTTLFGNAAGNWSDTLYEYSNTSSVVQITDAYTDAREKWDYSSSYAYNDASNTDIIQVRVKGGHTISNSFNECTYGTPKSLPIGQAYYFPNTVKENSYSYARLIFCPANGLKGMYLHIWWSPDSI